MNALCWLAKNDIITRDITGKIQHMAVRLNNEMIVKAVKAEKDERRIVSFA